MGSAFPRLITAYSFKSSEGNAETKPLNQPEDSSPGTCNNSDLLDPIVIYMCGGKTSKCNDPTITSPVQFQMAAKTDKTLRTVQYYRVTVSSFNQTDNSKQCCNAIKRIVI